MVQDLPLYFSWGEAIVCFHPCTLPEPGQDLAAWPRQFHPQEQAGGACSGHKRSGGCRRTAVRRGWHSYAWLVLCRLLHVLSFSPHVYIYLLCTCLPWLELEQECCHCDYSPIGAVLCIRSAVSVSCSYKACGMHLP